MSEIRPNRRTVVRTAAWTVPAVAVVAGAPQFAASTISTTTVQKEFEFRDALSNPVFVTVTAENLPLDVHPGVALSPVTTTSQITISDASRGLLGSFLLGNPAEIDGTSNSTIDFTGAFATSTTTPLAIARVPFPSSGTLNLTASGTSASLTIPAGTPAGVVTMTLGDPSSVLVGYNSSGGQSGTYDSNLAKVDGNDYVLHTFTIHDA